MCKKRNLNFISTRRPAFGQGYRGGKKACFGFPGLAAVRCDWLHRPGIKVQDKFNTPRIGTDVELSVQLQCIAFNEVFREVLQLAGVAHRSRLLCAWDLRWGTSLSRRRAPYSVAVCLGRSSTQRSVVLRSGWRRSCTTSQCQDPFRVPGVGLLLCRKRLAAVLKG